MMRLASWNVNSIRARSESVVAWARTTRGGRQFDLLEALAPSAGCASSYGLCEGVA